jgi:hypothetical protein
MRISQSAAQYVYNEARIFILSYLRFEPWSVETAGKRATNSAMHALDVFDLLLGVS